MDAAHQTGEVLEVRLLELFVILALYSCEDLVATRRRIAADILVIDQVGRYGQDESRRIGICNDQARVGRLQFSLLGKGDDIRLETHSVTFDLGNQVEYPGREIAPGAFHRQSVVRGGDVPLERALELCLHVHLAGFVGRDLHHHNVVWIGHEDFPGHLDVTLGIVDGDDAGLHVEFAIVILDRSFSGFEIKEQVTDRGVGLLVGGLSVEVLVHQFFRLLVFLGIHQFLDLVIVIVGLRIVIVVWTP